MMSRRKGTKPKKYRLRRKFDDGDGRWVPMKWSTNGPKIAAAKAEEIKGMINIQVFSYKDGKAL